MTKERFKEITRALEALDTSATHKLKAVNFDVRASVGVHKLDYGVYALDEDFYKVFKDDNEMKKFILLQDDTSTLELINKLSDYKIHELVSDMLDDWHDDLMYFYTELEVLELLDDYNEEIEA